MLKEDIFLKFIIINFIVISSCTEPNTIGINVQPLSDNIIISDTSSFNWQNSQNESEDSLRTDEALNLILGEINDLDFGINRGAFYTQILLTENNIDLGDNPIVDSVVMSYTCSGYYGNLENFTNIWMMKLSSPIYKDSTYYSNDETINTDMPYNMVQSFILNTESEETPVLRINLENYYGQQILDLGSDILKDNESFLQAFYGLELSAEAQNTMLYLNPNGTNSYFKIYYHNDVSGTDTLSLDFELGGEAARINLFNDKKSNSILEDNSKIYIQSMAGYKLKILLDKESIKSLLDGKIINKVNMMFEVENGSQAEYEAHEKLVLVRVNDQGENIFLEDYIEGGETYFGGDLQDGKYTFNITKYFFQMLNNELYTNELYLLSAGAAVNANRTILNKEIKFDINYSDL